jgi:hypothetical protein
MQCHQPLPRYRPSIYLIITYFSTYLPIHKTYLLSRFWTGWWWCVICFLWTKVPNLLCNNVLLCHGDWWHILGGYKTSSSGRTCTANTNSAHTLLEVTEFKMSQSLCIIHMPSPWCVHIYLQEGNNNPFLCCILLSKEKKKKPWKSFPLGF